MRFLLHIPVAIILLVLVVIALIFYVVTQTTLVHKGVKLVLAEYIERKYDVKVEFGNVGGSLTNNLTVENVHIDFDKEPNRYRILRAKKISVYYNINNLWHKIWKLDSLLVDEPIVVLRSDSTGELLVPKRPSSGSPDTKKSLTPNMVVDKVRLNNGTFQFIRPPRTYYVDSISFAGNGSIGEGTLSIGFDTLGLHYPQKNFHIRELRIAASYTGSAVGIDSFYLVTDSSHIKGGGVYPLGDTLPYSFKFTDSHLSFTELSAVLGLGLIGGVDFTLNATGTGIAFSGNADMDGTLFARRLGPLNSDYSYADGVLKFTNLKGAAFDGQLEGNAELNLIARPETFEGELTVTGLNLDKIVPETFKSRINGKLKIDGSGLGGNSFNLDLGINSGRSSFDFVNYDSLSGAISINVDNMYFHPGFSLFYKHSRFTAEGPVNYKGEMLLNGDFHTSQLADYWNDLFIKKLSGGGSATYAVTGSNNDPDIKGEFRGDSCSFYGFATDSLFAGFDIKSFLYKRQGQVDLHSFKSNVWNLPAESVQCSLDLDSNIVTINDAKLFDNRTLLASTGVAVIHDTTASVEIKKFDFTFDTLHYENVTPIDVEFLADRITVDSFKVKGNEGLVSARCVYGYDSTITVAAETDSFVFAPWLQVLQIDTLTSGVLSAKGEMTGKLRNPKVKLHGSVSDLTYGPTTLGTLETDLTYQDSIVRFDDLNLHYQGGDISATGTFPFIMNLDSGLAYVPAHPMQLTFTSNGTDLSLLSSLNHDIESLTGEYNLQFDLYGTPKQPQAKGTFDLKNGTVKIYQMENPIENIEAHVTSDGKLVRVEWAEGKVRYKKREGTVRANGLVYIRNSSVFDYRDLEIVGSDVPFKYDLADIYGLVDFDLSINGSVPPEIKGNVLVKDAEYSEEFETEKVSAALMAADTLSLWNYDILLDMLPGSVKVKNSNVNMVLDGNLNVVRKNAKNNYFGTLNVVRGNSYFFDLNFNIEPGSQIVFNNIETPDPSFNWTISSRVRNYTGDVTSASYDNLQLTLGGTVSQPQISAASGSPYTDEDILSVILINRAVSGAGGDTLSTPLDSRIKIGTTGLIAARASQAIARSLGVEVFDITPTYNEKNSLQGAAVSLGLYTLPNIYTYISSLSIDGRADYGAEYRLGRHVYLGGQLDRDRLVHFNINLNWEFR